MRIALNIFIRVHVKSLNFVVYELCHGETCLRRCIARQQSDVVSFDAYAWSDRALSVVRLGYEHTLCYYCCMDWVSRCLAA